MLRYFYIALIAIMAAAPASALNSDDTAAVPAAYRDTKAIVITKPSAAKEESVFSDRHLKYKQEVNNDPGILERLINSLADLLFDNVSSDSLNATRKLIVWTVVIICLVVVIRILSRSSITGLTRSSAKSTGFNFNDVTESLDSIDYAKRVADALQAGDFRLAIRWHYLEMLYNLDRKQLIVFAPYKTNIDYRYELKNANIQDFFSALSRIYDYVWYGQFVISETDYRTNAETFSELKKRLHV